MRPTDDEPHEHGAEPGWEERLTFEARDEAHGYAIAARMTHRPGDRTADAELAIALPGGETARALSRAQEAKRAELTVGRLTIVIERPLQRWRVVCRDVALVLPAGEARGVATQVDLDLEFEAASEPEGASDRRTEVDDQKFLTVTSRGRFVQAVQARGRLRVGSGEIAFTGSGSRERAWGVLEPADPVDPVLPG